MTWWQWAVCGSAGGLLGGMVVANYLCAWLAAQDEPPPPRDVTWELVEAVRARNVALRAYQDAEANMRAAAFAFDLEEWDGRVT